MLKMIFLQAPKIDTWDSGVHALKDALTLEATVTRNITDIIKACENPSGDGSGANDYHVCHFIFLFLSFIMFGI
jgi:hypothetical protein